MAVRETPAAWERWVNPSQRIGTKWFGGRVSSLRSWPVFKASEALHSWGLTMKRFLSIVTLLLPCNSRFPPPIVVSSSSDLWIPRLSRAMVNSSALDPQPSAVIATGSVAQRSGSVWVCRNSFVFVRDLSSSIRWSHLRDVQRNPQSLPFPTPRYPPSSRPVRGPGSYLTSRCGKCVTLVKEVKDA